MKRSPFLLLGLLPALAFLFSRPATAATLPPELAALDEQFHQLRQERVVTPFATDLAKLDSGYLASLSRKLAEEKAAGRLDSVLALEAEQQRLASSQPLPQTDAPATPACLKELRAIYRQQLLNLTTQRSANLKALTDPLDRRLAQLEADFTKADRLPDAKMVRAYREQLAETGVDASPAASALAPGGAFTNTLGMKFVPVPGTTVLFCIHETRRQDYAAYAAQRSGVDSAWKNQLREGVPVGDKDTHPVVAVSWEDAQKFCAWLSQKEGKTYRLPTDEEWSIAAGLGRREKQGKGISPEILSQTEQTLFPWEDDYPPQTMDKAGNYADESWHEKFPAQPWIEKYSDGFATTAPVMSFQPNKLGLYDMGGNIWEWVGDWWNPAQKDRVLRGASFDLYARTHLLASQRSHNTPGSRYNPYGFRCVVETVAKVTAANTSTPTPPPAASTDPVTNTLGMKFVPVPGTNVLFCIHETRHKDYAAYAAQAQGVDGAWKNQGMHIVRQIQNTNGLISFQGGDLHPVVRVSWEDAQQFCSWLSQKEGRAYRLPTDREWSIAAGLGRQEQWTADTTPATVAKSNTAFPWGDAWPPPPGSGNYSDSRRKLSAPSANSKYLGNYDDGFPATAPVMSFQPNALGLYDLGGNVWEWVADWYNRTRQHRTLRGASFTVADRDYLLSSYRTHNPPGFRHDNHGFRIVLERAKP